MKKGDRVLVPRHGGQYCPGRVMDVYTDRARVTFQVGEAYRGKKVTKLMREAWVFKTVKLGDLVPMI